MPHYAELVAYENEYFKNLDDQKRILNGGALQALKKHLTYGPWSYWLPRAALIACAFYPILIVLICMDSANPEEFVTGLLAPPALGILAHLVRKSNRSTMEMWTIQHNNYAEKRNKYFIDHPEAREAYMQLEEYQRMSPMILSAAAALIE